MYHIYISISIDDSYDCIHLFEDCHFKWRLCPTIPNLSIKHLHLRFSMSTLDVAILLCIKVLLDAGQGTPMPWLNGSKW